MFSRHKFTWPLAYRCPNDQLSVPYSMWFRRWLISICITGRKQDDKAAWNCSWPLFLHLTSRLAVLNVSVDHYFCTISIANSKQLRHIWMPIATAGRLTYNYSRTVPAFVYSTVRQSVSLWRRRGERKRGFACRQRVQFDYCFNGQIYNTVCVVDQTN